MNERTKLKLRVITDIKCYEAHRKHDVDCMKRSCERWIDHSDSCNCIAVAIMNGPHTLNEIGVIHGLSRMRICQIEKNAKKQLLTAFKAMFKQE